MCGIAGYLDFTLRTYDPSVIEVMGAALARRGPDDAGVARLGACALAHRRLSIIDLAHSTQPMRIDPIPFTLVYNGELYNYRELRADLEAHGHIFSTKGDTEVVLRMLAQYGPESVARFDGMFAFAAWNEQTRELILARDQIGEKPLFYAMVDGAFVFASEIKAVRRFPGCPSRVDHDALRQAMRFRAVYGSRTLFESIASLMPGCWMRVNAAGVEIKRYFDLAERVTLASQRVASLDDASCVRLGREVFEQSVSERLIADVPVGAFLSGGLDSSLITAEIRRLRGPGTDIRTYSVGFDGDANSELPFAAEVASTFSTLHQQVLVGPRDFVAHLDELTSCRDAPMSEPADLAIACMSRRAKQDVKVVLSGEGADEAFAGYPKYLMARVPTPVGSLIRSVGPARLASVARAIRADPRRALVAARALAEPDEVHQFAHWFSYTEREQLRAWFPAIDWSHDAWERTLLPHHDAASGLAAFTRIQRMQLVDCRTWLPGNLLERGDRMTMAEGLECRPPFLDTELVSLGIALPDRLKVRGRTGKWILRQWARDMLPESIRRRRKWGFRVPLAAWFRGDLRDYVRDTLLDPRGYLASIGDLRAISDLLNRHDAGEDLNLTIWTMLTIEIWGSRVLRASA